jgi:hypothetical protein
LWEAEIEAWGLAKPLQSVGKTPTPQSGYMDFEIALVTTCGTSTIFMALHLLP